LGGGRWACDARDAEADARVLHRGRLDDEWLSAPGVFSARRLSVIRRAYMSAVMVCLALLGVPEGTIQLNRLTKGKQ